MKAISLDLLHKCTRILSTLILDILCRSQLHICIFLCLFPSVLHIICHNSHSVRCSSQYYCLFLNIEHFHHEGRILSARRGVSHIIMHLKCLRLNCFSNSVWFTSGLSGGGCEFDSVCIQLFQMTIFITRI
uniref:Uncharacterized protein n=1 Tax=Cacopsylla melanoneura TaxID=428564 RepID=A0A8D8X426_9HEMI